MTTSSNAELKGVPALQIQSDLNVHGGEYRPRTVSNPIRARPPVASFPKTAQATRHARRLYFGGFSPSTEEDALKHFLNEVISAGLNEGNDDSYILSIYLNQKKCFAFVELKSIELTTACLFLDGVVMDGLPLKVQRANEYKPELVPAVKSVVELDLSKIQFYDGQSPLPKNNTYNTGDAFSRDRMTIPHVDLSMLKLGDIVLVGIKIGSEEATDSNIPNARRVIKNYLYSVRTSNPEYAVDISDINVVDVGDVQLTMEDIDSDGGKMAVQNMIASIVHAGGYPVLLGAPGSSKGKASSPFSCDDNYLHASICGVLSSFSDPTSYMGGGVAGIPSVALLSASARIRKVCHLLLSDTAFSRNSHNIDSCDGRLRSFGVQGSHCTVEDTRSMLTSGGVLTWLTRDIRGADKKHSNSHGNLLPFKKNNTNSANLLFTTTGILFQEVMQELSARKDPLSKSSTSAMGSQKSVVVSLHPDASMYAAAATSACPLGSRCGACSDISSQGGEGFSPVEWFDVALVTGQYKNVSLIFVTSAQVHIIFYRSWH